MKKILITEDELNYLISEKKDRYPLTQPETKPHLFGYLKSEYIEYNYSPINNDSREYFELIKKNITYLKERRIKLNNIDDSVFGSKIAFNYNKEGDSIGLMIRSFPQSTYMRWDGQTYTYRGRVNRGSVSIFSLEQYMNPRLFLNLKRKTLLALEEITEVKLREVSLINKRKNGVIEWYV